MNVTQNSHLPEIGSLGREWREEGRMAVYQDGHCKESSVPQVDQRTTVLYAIGEAAFGRRSH